jgi:hypothetical protein
MIKYRVIQADSRAACVTLRGEIRDEVDLLHIREWLRGIRSRGLGLGTRRGGEYLHQPARVLGRHLFWATLEGSAVRFCSPNTLSRLWDQKYDRSLVSPLLEATAVAKNLGFTPNVFRIAKYHALRRLRHEAKELID